MKAKKLQAIKTQTDARAAIEKLLARQDLPIRLKAYDLAVEVTVALEAAGFRIVRNRPKSDPPMYAACGKCGQRHHVDAGCRVDVVEVEVEMLAFGDGKIRTVEVPAAEFVGDLEHKLERVFLYGQNDVQRRPFPSVSVGDVIRLGGAGHYRVEPMGFVRMFRGQDKDVVARGARS